MFFFIESIFHGPGLIIVQVGVGLSVFFIACKYSKNFKRKRLFKRCQQMQSNLTTAQAKKFLRFLKWYTLSGIRTADVAWMLIETQHQVNRSPDISAEVKRRIYEQLRLKRIEWCQQQITRYNNKKNGNRIS